MDTKAAVIEAVGKFVKSAADEGETVDISKVDYDQLTATIVEERQSGREGTTFDLLLEVNDSIGLSQFGIFTM